MLKMLMAIEHGPEHALAVLTRHRTALIALFNCAAARTATTAPAAALATAPVADALVVRRGRPALARSLRMALTSARPEMNANDHANSRIRRRRQIVRSRRDRGLRPACINLTLTPGELLAVMGLARVRRRCSISPGVSKRRAPDGEGRRHDPRRPVGRGTGDDAPSRRRLRVRDQPGAVVDRRRERDAPLELDGRNARQARQPRSPRYKRSA